jgi:hypothetical protein
VRPTTLCLVHGFAIFSPAGTSRVQPSFCLSGCLQVRPLRFVSFMPGPFSLSGGTSGRRAATRPGRVWFLLERNPPNRPLAPAGTPALLRESNSVPLKTKRNYMKTNAAPVAPKSTPVNGTKHPVKTIRLGRIQAAIWQNTSENKPFFSVVISRTYKDAQGYHNTDSFGRDDLLVVAKIADMAHTAVIQLLEASKADQDA